VNAMIVQRHAEKELRPDQVRAMAQNLYHLAQIDGISDREKSLIREFLQDGKVDLDLEALAKIPFSLDGLSAALDTIFLRKTFLKVCLFVALGDGEISQAELAELRRIAQALEITDPVEVLISEVKSRSTE